MFAEICVALILLYVLVSLCFLFNPNILHSKRTAYNRANHGRYVHISHRGGAGEAYENTLGAYRNAIKHGCQHLEMDVRRTKDGVVVVCHDMDLTRMCGESVRVDQLNYAELPLLGKSVALDSQPGVSFQGNEKDDRKIPTLESVFEEFPDIGINIDIKNCDIRMIRTVDELIRRFKRENRTVWGSFSHDTTELCRQANPKAGILFSFKRVIRILVLFYTGLLPFVDISETYFEIPMISTFKAGSLPEVGLTKQPRTAFRNAIATLLDAILTRPLLFHHLRARGIEVYLWVLNSEDEFKRAFRSGASGVMTDYPQLLAKFLKENPEYVR